MDIVKEISECEGVYLSDSSIPRVKIKDLLELK